MKPTSLLFCMTLLASAAAEAQSQGQQYYASCLAQTEQEYRFCLRNERGPGSGCRFSYLHEKERCWNAYMQVERDTSSPYYPAPQRFEPVPIPQRPVYILPGMR